MYQFGSQEAIVSSVPVKKLSIPAIGSDGKPIFNLKTTADQNSNGKGNGKRKATEMVGWYRLKMNSIN